MNVGKKKKKIKKHKIPGGTTNMEPNKLKLGWAEYFASCDYLISLLKHDEKFTDIIAIARGGLIPAQYIAYQLDIPRIHSYGVRSYTKDDMQGESEVYQRIDIPFGKEYRYLIVDDVADTGSTIRSFIEQHHEVLATTGGHRVAVLYWKEGKSTINPDFCAQSVEPSTWIVYPYDV